MHSKQSQTDQVRLDDLSDDEIDLSDNPEVSTEMFARAVVRQGLEPVAPKEQIPLHMDEDVLR